ncbi:hypothetical protein HPB50_011248 [Hyalomma asiaticum]|uniref:Uncharacterized protein n=1 Tax=Hyalomma asiaticum TaxID=266040 RepID=A0ACB7SIL4_HYAAI|nr:hypothetical protein HPB50_011248 [Hyalomma asiaticum]
MDESVSEKKAGAVTDGSESNGHLVQPGECHVHEDDGPSVEEKEQCVTSCEMAAESSQTCEDANCSAVENVKNECHVHEDDGPSVEEKERWVTSYEMAAESSQTCEEVECSELTSGMVPGSSSSDDIEVDPPEECAFTQAPAPQQASNIEDCITGCKDRSSDSGGGAHRKRKRYTGAEIKEKMLNELLREKFEAPHKEEMEIHSKALKLQEKLVDTMVAFFNKN